MPLPEDNRELYELVFDLQRRSINTAPLGEADVDATTGTLLLSATKELRLRGLPDMYNPTKGIYEVRWGEPHGDAVTFHTERYRSMDDALARARQLQDAFRDLDGYP